MRLSYCTLIWAGFLFLALPLFASGGPRHGSARLHAYASVNHPITRHKKAMHAVTHREVPSVAMPAERATQIQTALIKQGYLSGEPSGAWDAQTNAAMQKMQSDNGWQSKVTPDSRALIKLGLGPDQTTETTAQVSPQ
jgi:hypothetical protein